MDTHIWSPGLGTESVQNSENYRIYYFLINNWHTNCVRHLYSVQYLILNSQLVLCEVHYNDVIMGAIASQITSLTMVYSIVYSDADQRKHQSSASLAFVRWIHRGPGNSPHKWSVTRKMFPLDDVIMVCSFYMIINVKLNNMFIPLWSPQCLYPVQRSYTYFHFLHPESPVLLMVLITMK